MTTSKKWSFRGVSFYRILERSIDLKSSLKVYWWASVTKAVQTVALILCAWNSCSCANYCPFLWTLKNAAKIYVNESVGKRREFNKRLSTLTINLQFSRFTRKWQQSVEKFTVKSYYPFKAHRAHRFLTATKHFIWRDINLWYQVTDIKQCSFPYLNNSGQPDPI